MPTRFGPTRSWMIAEKRRSKYTETGTRGKTTTKVSVMILTMMVMSKAISMVKARKSEKLAINRAGGFAGPFVFEQWDFVIGGSDHRALIANFGKGKVFELFDL